MTWEPITNITGPRGPKGDAGPQGAPGADAIPQQDAVAAWLADPNSPVYQEMLQSIRSSLQVGAIDVIVGMGQSNSVGINSDFANPGVDGPDANVLMWGTNSSFPDTYHQVVPASVPLQGMVQSNDGSTGLGAVFVLAKAWAAYTGRQVLVVEAGVGGAGFRGFSGAAWAWKVGGGISGAQDASAAAVAEINAAIAAVHGRLAAVVWQHGETDARNYPAPASTAQYAGDLDQLIGYVRANAAGGASVPWVISGMIPEAVDNFFPGGIQVQTALADTPSRTKLTSYVAPPRGYNPLADHLHLSAQGQRVVGQQMLDALLVAQQNRPGIGAGIVRNASSQAGVGTVRLSWQAPMAPTTGIRVTWRVNSGFPKTASLEGSDTGYTIGNLGPGDRIDWKLTAVNGQGDSAQSVSGSSVTNAGPGAPSAGAAAWRALSLRQVVSTYTGPLIRVHLQGSAVETDIGQKNGGLDVAALLTIAGASGTVLVSRWYDQKAVGDFVQATVGQQPAIVIEGVLQTMDGGAPALRFSSSATTNLVSTVAGLYADGHGASALALAEGFVGTSGAPGQALISEGRSGGTGGYYVPMMVGTTGYYLAQTIFSSAADLNAGQGEPPTPFLNGIPHHLAAVDDGATTFAKFVDGVAQTPLAYTRSAAVTGQDRLAIGARVRNAIDQPFEGLISEVLLYQTAISASVRSTGTTNQLAYAGLN